MRFFRTSESAKFPSSLSVFKQKIEIFDMQTCLVFVLSDAYRELLSVSRFFFRISRHYGLLFKVFLTSTSFVRSFFRSTVKKEVVACRVYGSMLMVDAGAPSIDRLTLRLTRWFDCLLCWSTFSAKCSIFLRNVSFFRNRRIEYIRLR